MQKSLFLLLLISTFCCKSNHFDSVQVCTTSADGKKLLATSTLESTAGKDDRFPVITVE